MVEDNLGAMDVAMTLEQCWHRVPGGTAVAALGMARALLGQRDVAVVGVAARHRVLPDAEFVPPVEVRHFPLPRSLLYETWHRLRWPPVERATGSVDVIHATALAIPPPTAPLVVTIHDLAFVHHPGYFTQRGLRLFHRGLDLARADADIVMCPSRATLDDCARHGFERARLRLVPLGVDIAPATASDVARVKTRFGLDRPYVLWTGTIEPRKNLRRLLAAFRAVDRELDLVIVGPVGWNEDLAGAVGGLDDRVKLLGFVPRTELGPLYAGAEVFCFPSLMEGFGFPVLEAMAQGTPVVTARGTSTEELGREAAVLVDPYDVSSIAEGIAHALDRRDVLAADGKRRAAEYSWSRTAAVLAEVYREVS